MSERMTVLIHSDGSMKTTKSEGEIEELYEEWTSPGISHPTNTRLDFICMDAPFRSTSIYAYRSPQNDGTYVHVER